MVFDCSAKYQGTSLNDALLQGPDLTNNLVGILIRFRQDPVAFCADIKSMFLRVRVPSKDRDAMRFLWFTDNDLNGDLQQWRMCSHLFGSTSSPCVASYALLRTANDNLTSAEPTAITTVRRNFYVDDVLRSLDSTDEAVRLISELRALLASGGFHLNKFISNSSDVLGSVPLSDRAMGIESLNLDRSPQAKTLGLTWNMNSDSLEIPVILDPKPLKRRGMLSTVSQCFDPLGFIQPFLLPARKLLQNLNTSQYGWDDAIEGEPKRKFERWREGLKQLTFIKLTRCHRPANFKPIFASSCIVSLMPLESRTVPLRTYASWTHKAM